MLALAAALLQLPGRASAEPARAAKQSPGRVSAALNASEEKSAHVPSASSSALVRYQLPNGLRVVLDMDGSETSVVACLTLPLGSRDDPDGAEGAAWLWQRLQGSAPARSPRAERLRELGARGGSSSARVGTDHSVVITRAPPGALELALGVSADYLAPPLVSRAEYGALVRSAAAAYELEQPPSLDAIGEQRLRQLVFQGFDPYARLGFSSPQSIVGIPLDTVVRLHEDRVHAGSAVLAVSGLFSEADARRWVRRHFGVLPRGSAQRAAEPFEPARQTSERFNASVHPKAKAPLAFYAWSVPTSDDRATTSLGVLGQLMQNSAALSARHSETPDIDDVRAWVMSSPGPAAFAVRLSVSSRSNIDKARGVLERELSRLSSNGPSHTELERAKTSFGAELLTGLDSAATRAVALGRSELEAGDARRAFGHSGELARVSATDIQKLVREHLVETRRTAVEIYPPGWQQDQPPEIVRRQHIVKPGENLIQIAKRYHSSVEAIASANKIRRHHFIFPGQSLIIPVKTADLERAKRRSYRVKPGDTLIAIAARHGVTAASLAEANARRPNQTLRSGETLTIPDPPRRSSGSTASAPKQRRHRVQRGDSLLGLAKKYGVSAADIAAANGRRPKQPILAGEVLVIPSPPARRDSAAPADSKRSGAEGKGGKARGKPAPPRPPRPPAKRSP